MDRITESLHKQINDLGESHASPIWLTSAYNFKNAETAEKRFTGEESGNIYSRFTNPSVNELEQKIAILENAEDAICFASGMATYTAIALTFLKQGDNVLIAGGVFGSTTVLIRKIFSKFGITSTLLPPQNPESWMTNITKNTKLIILETPSNPIMRVYDIDKLKRQIPENILLVVDNTILTPIFQLPLRHGADLVINSLGKYFDGQGRVVAGAVAGSKRLINQLLQIQRSVGFTLSAFDAWLLSVGTDTLEIRMKSHQQNAMFLAEKLIQHNMVEKVFYTGVEKNNNIIIKQQSGFGGLISFKIKTDKIGTIRFINSLKLIKICTNIGGARSLVTHPATTTHCKYNKKERKAFGIDDNLVRLSVGLENAQDIFEDLDFALAQLNNKV
ncbi:O-acetylhomoserine sulfhydrylase / O-succinylhomoserine sulfhydrylase [Snodgrassella communis]|nr:aminotransferase class I/II-fold pyridoxal phosphate-dependent enzyme [Snodgrassella communis]KDN12088.1 O-acetylhomoserine sulfhydrylase / O-succinylhomoserine sulfhydrylase [Snodgrassella communis]